MNNDEIPRNNRILIIDDNLEIHADFRKILDTSSHAVDELARLRAAVLGAPAQGESVVHFCIDSAHQGEEGAAKVRAAVKAGDPYAIAFVDMRMPPGWDGLRTIQEIWRIDSALQIVICTAYSDHPWKDIEAVASETDRLLVLKKPFDAIEVRRLAATLTAKWTNSHKAAMKLGELNHLVGERTAQLEMARRKDQLHMEELERTIEKRTAELRLAATHDGLTGLPNRTLFHDRLSQALALSVRNPDLLVAVLFIDFDCFKVINDSLGHDAGDRVLRIIGQRLSSVLRNTDTVSVEIPVAPTAARLGGDEFCLLLTGLRHAEDACIVADRILRELERPYEIGGRQVHSTASIGIGVGGAGSHSAEELVREADSAMYRAKSDGKSRFVMFDHAMHEKAMNRMTVERDLQGSIDRHELQTFFQPVVSLISGEVTGAEALIRWNHAERGRIEPKEFIGIAEETGFIEKLGLWILEDACTHMARWRSTIPSSAKLSLNVNVSSRQLLDPQFSCKVESILSRAGLEPSALALEITESVLMEKSSRIEYMLAALRKTGVRLFLDDFGTGFSSLSVVHAVDLDGLKIDRSFVSGATGRRRYAAIIHTIMNLAHTLGMDGVAEGIESIEHVALLQSLGCSRGQGYLFSPPIAAEPFEVMLRKNERSWAPIQESAA